ncbi:MAG: PQQ-binding-like beta-propeller repeat protein [Myxococcota bacterium]|nr:PQQ-binding-like beta-propeller repeat protein [Myxococcota bacterium]
MHTAALIGLAVMLVGASPTAPAGWLGDGTGHFAGTSVPKGWSAAKPGGWSTRMPAWGNASPVVVGDRIVVTAEPLSVVCVSASKGKILWTHEVSYLDTVGPADRARVKRDQADAARTVESLRVKERALNKLKRAMRKARGSKDARARTEALLAEIGPLKARLDRYAHLRPPEPIDIMGTAPSTPVSDGRAIYALMGNGVVVSLTLEGAVRWAHHLGAPTQRMRGFHKGQTASPQLIDGVLVVALNHLTGLDPKTGAVKWQRPESYADFGAPRPMRIDGVSLVVTPLGDVIRVSDGVRIAHDIGGNIYFVSPLTDGRRVYFVGATTDPDLHERTALAIDLEGPLSALRTRRVWRTSLPKEKTYATPLLHQGLIYTVGIRGSLVVLEAATGKVVYDTVLPLGLGDVMPSPVIAGDEIVFAGGSGEVVVIRAGRRHEVLFQSKLGEMRATPALVGGRLYVRSLDRLWSLTAP